MHSTTWLPGWRISPRPGWPWWGEPATVVADNCCTALRLARPQPVDELVHRHPGVGDQRHEGQELLPMLGQKLQQSLPIRGLRNLVYFLHGGSLSFQGICLGAILPDRALERTAAFHFSANFPLPGGHPPS